MRLLLDEMIGPRVADALRRDGHEVVAVAERPELRALADEAVLEVATDEHRAVVTRNVADFARLGQQWAAAGRTHAGILMVTEGAFPQSRNLVGSLVLALQDADQSGDLPQPDEVVYLRPPAAVR